MMALVTGTSGFVGSHMPYLGYQYYKSYSPHVVRTRTFNHTGTGRWKPEIPFERTMENMLNDWQPQPPLHSEQGA